MGHACGAGRTCVALSLLVVHTATAYFGYPQKGRQAAMCMHPAGFRQTAAPLSKAALHMPVDMYLWGASHVSTTALLPFLQGQSGLVVSACHPRDACGVSHLRTLTAAGVQQV